MRIPRDEPAAIGRPYINLPAEIAAAVLQTIRTGWQLLSGQSEVGPDWLEVPTTERLRDCMREALLHQPWGKTMVVLPGTESQSRPTLNVPDGLTDIPILLIEVFLSQGAHEPHAIIECKRVAAGDAGLCRRYVVDGVDRFKRGKYAGNHRIGFMAGYVIDGDGAGAVSAINRYLSKNARTGECLQSSRIVQESWAWQSAHPRESEVGPIELHHAMLEFVVRAAL